jgi:hexosaminidase
MNTDLIHLSANAPLIQPVLPMSNNLSTISKQLLLEEKKDVDKSIECVIGTIHYSIQRMWN